MCPSGTLRFKSHASSFMAVLQYPLYQSEYRQRYSTDAALLKVANDLSLNMNSQHVTLLLLLDLSAAFDTVNHEILVRRLNTNFGVRGKVLLPRRSQRISLSELCHIWKVWLTFLPQWWDNTWNPIEEECVFIILVPKYLVPESSLVTPSENSQTISTLNSEGLSLVRDCFKDFCWNFVAHPNYINKNLIPDISGKA